MSNIFETPRFTDAFKHFQAGTTFGLDEHQANLGEARMVVRQEWNRRLDGRVWKSHDLAVDQSLLSPPKSVSFASIEVDPQEMLPFTDCHPYAVSCLLATTRSRFAQLGLVILEGASLDIARTISVKQAPDGSTRYKAEVPIMNFSARPIFLPEGTKLFYLYYWNGNTIKGIELKKQVGDNIAISGDDQSWRWWYGPNTEKRDEHITGIEFLIDEQTRRWIPPSEEPISINDGPATNHDRKEVDKYLVGPIPQTPNPILWIAQIQAHLKLSGVHGIVDRMIPRDFGSPLGDQEQQINSFFLDGNNTNSRIRTEIVSPTTEELIPRSIVVRFIKDGR